jgi:L-lactate dehydrogenase complex protein LldG
MPGISREEFLDGVRAALGKSSDAPEPDYLPLKIRREDQRQKVVTIEARAQVRRAEALGHLERTAARQGWKTHRAASAEDAVSYVVGLATERGARLVVRSDHEVFRRVPVEAALRGRGTQVVTVAANHSNSRGQLREQMAQADIGITGVDYAIAETGTCVLVPRQGVSRVVSLLPPVHVAIVEPHQVYETLDDLFALRRMAFLEGEGDMGSYLSLISGPSRTGDIEQTIVIGVHGPTEVHMVILNETA